MREVIDCWDKKAKQWKEWVGDQGDDNRRFNSDPILWKFAGDVSGKTVLDAGCGTGYLSIQMAEKSAQVIGIDVSPEMIHESKNSLAGKNLPVEFREDSAMELKTIRDASIDLLISNYVLMDLPFLDQAITNFYRVLKPGGHAVCVIAHPSNGDMPENLSYFEEHKVKERWGPFESDFIYFHRPISEYWKSFKRAGFSIEELEEPVVQDPNVPGFKKEWFKKYREKPWSLAFLLKK